MLYKTIIPNSEDLRGQSPVEILRFSSRGLDKTASMQKRAAAFQEELKDLKPEKNKAYLHVITTGAYETYGSQRNCFLGETLVVTSKGSKPIKDIQAGQLVKTRTGLHKVIRSIGRVYTGNLISLIAQGIPAVTMTEDHPVLACKDSDITKAQFISANLVSVGYNLFLDGVSVPITNIVKYKSDTQVTVYNLQVEEDHTFCVPFIVHNCDAWNQDYMTIHPPLAKQASCKQVKLDGGLKKYHKTYLQKAAVYQQHQTDQKPSGMVKAAIYNDNMHRGQLLIQVDVDMWAPRLQKRASGQDIYLSVGASMDHDVCSACGKKAHTLDQHCDHIKKFAGAILEDGTKVCMINDSPRFYDISGVNTPADPLAFVLRKVASGSPAMDAIQNKYLLNGTRPSLGFSKAAGLLSKLSKMQKQLICKVQDDPLFEDEDSAIDDFLRAVENYDADEVIDQCNRKAILLSPKMLFKLLGKQSDERDLFDTFADNCPCDCHHLMQDMEFDPLFKPQLSDGSFDTSLPVDLNLSDILQKFIPEFGVSRPAMNGKAIRVVIKAGFPEDKSKFKNKLKDKQTQDSDSEDKEPKDMQKQAALVGDQFRRTYARYVLSFAAKNNEDTCHFALQKLARCGTVKS